jgi:putative transposase
MKRHRHPPEQIVRKLCEGEAPVNESKDLTEGKDLTEVVRHLGIAESTWNRWPSQYGALRPTRPSGSASSRPRTPG